MPAGAHAQQIESNSISCHVVSEGQGPLVLMVHGFPELWYSWRHQLGPIAQAGYLAAALDMRGYGSSSKPHPVDAYDVKHIAGDLAGLIDQMGGGRAVLIGHDLGAPIVYATCLLYPDKVRAVAGLSVPCQWPAPKPPLELTAEIFKDRFFYVNYFQNEGVAEAEFQRDIRTGLRKFYYAISGDAPRGTYPVNNPLDADLLSTMPDPDPFPAWLTRRDEDLYVEGFTKSGFRGPINRYRCSDRDWHFLKPYADHKIQQPTLFIGGEKDLVRRSRPGTDAYASADERLADCRGIHLIPGAGHWVQQEAPDAVNEHLLEFLKGL